MRARTIALILATLVAAVVVCFAAQDVFMGTWKLNEAKSKVASRTGKILTAVYAMAGDSVKVTTDGVDTSGKPTHVEWTGKFDGKDYAVTGDPQIDMRSYTQVNDHTLRINETKGGKVVVSGTLSISADGKTRTVRVTQTDAKGNKTTSTRIYDKQ